MDVSPNATKPTANNYELICTGNMDANVNILLGSDGHNPTKVTGRKRIKIETEFEFSIQLCINWMCSM